MAVIFEEVELNDLNTGDQIAVTGNLASLSPFLLTLMPHSNGVYFHHGIFDRENLAVIDLHGENKEDAKPNRRPFLSFFKGHDKLYRVIHEETLSVEKTMMMAEEVLRQQHSWPAYDLIKNNCETFATYLKTGIPTSSQVFEAAKELVTRLLASPLRRKVIGSSPRVRGASVEKISKRSMDAAAGSLHVLKACYPGKRTATEDDSERDELSDRV